MMTVYQEYQYLKGEYNMQGVFNKKDLEIMNTFYTERCINKRTQYGYNNSFSLYVQYTRMHLQDLLLEADIEEEKGVRWKKCKLKEGDTLIFSTFGSGFTSGACIIKW